MTADITTMDRYECLAALYAKRYGQRGPGQYDPLPYSTAHEENLSWLYAWLRYLELPNAVVQIIELERELAAARAALEGEPR